MWRKMIAFAAAALVAVVGASAQGIDADIRLGDEFTGKILFPADVDVVRFESVLGAQVSVTVSGKGKLQPYAFLVDAETGQLVQTAPFEAGVGKAKFKIKKAPLPKSGAYELHVLSFNGKKGNYTLTTKVAYPDALSQVKGTFSMSAGMTTPLLFEAQPGTEVKGTIKFSNGLAVGLDTLVTPDGPLDITPFVTPKSTKLKLAAVKIAGIGQHALLIEGDAGSGQIDVKIDVIHPKLKKKKWKEPNESKTPGAIAGTLMISDLLVQPEVEPNGTPGTAAFLGLGFPGNSLRASGFTTDNGIPGGLNGDPLQSADLDGWRVQFNQSQTVFITMVHNVQADFDIGVFDSVSGTPIGFIESADEPEQGILDVAVTGGDPVSVDFVVYSYQGTGGYLLSMVSTSPVTTFSDGGGSNEPGAALRPVPGKGVAGSPAGVDHYLGVDREFIDGEFVVCLEDEHADRAEFAARHGLNVRIASPAGPFVAQIPSLAGRHDVDARRETVRRAWAVNASDEVRFAHPNFIYHAQALPNDTFLNYQWHYPLIGLPQAWDLTKGSPNVVVAVIDTGVVNHPDLASRFTNDGKDFISFPQISLDGDGIDNNPTDPGDQNLDFGKSTWHGTHVAGTIGAETNNGLGVAGVDWFCRIMPIRVLGKGGGTDFDICEGIRYAAGLSNASFTLPTKKANVLNLSLGGPNFSQNCASAVAQAKAAGSVVVCAAGNDNVGTPAFPASYDGAISVSAVDLNKQKAAYSNFGAFIDVAAPGGDVSVDKNNDGLVDGVLSTLVDEDANAFNFVAYQGTSMAAPHVAGVCALLLSANPTLTPNQVESLLKTTAQDLGTAGRDDIFGDGLVNAFAAVSAATAAQTPQLSVSTTQLDFGTAQTTLSIGVSNAGAGTLSWSATDSENSGGNWLSINPASGNAPSNISVTVNRTGVPVGVYFGQVAITSNGGSANVSVRMEVAAGGGPPVISLSSTALNFGGTQNTLQLVVQNAGGGTLNYTAVDSENSGGNWLSINPTQGNLAAGASQTMTVTVNRSGLAAGAYAGSIGFSSNGGAPIVAVSMNVPSGSQPTLSLSAESIHFPAAVTQASVGVFNVGGGTLTFNATDAEFSGGNWLSVTPVNGSAPNTLTVKVNRAGLAAGSYSGQVNVNSNGGQKTIAVTMEVTGQALVPYNLGPVFVLAVDPFTLASKAQAVATKAAPAYTLSSVPVGTWLLVAGPDLDQDNFICGVGEPCGLFPVSSDPVAILVTGGAFITGANFAVTNELLLPTLFGAGFQIPPEGFSLTGE